jgi:hypothetical protein
VTAEMHEFLVLGLQYRPEQRSVDLNQIAAWAAPVAIEHLTWPSNRSRRIMRVTLTVAFAVAAGLLIWLVAR